MINCLDDVRYAVRLHRPVSAISNTNVSEKLPHNPAIIFFVFPHVRSFFSKMHFVHLK